MSDPRAPHRVIAFLLEDEAVHGEVNAESAFHKQQHRGATLVALPVGSFFPTGVNAPLDLDTFRLANVGVHEVADNPTAVIFTVADGVTRVPSACAHEILPIAGTLTWEGPGHYSDRLEKFRRLLKERRPCALSHLIGRVQHVNASDTATQLLSGVGMRVAHSRAVAGQAIIVATLLDTPWTSALIDAAWLHDVGYAPAVVDTGFHPLDGARYLRDRGWPSEVCRLVAWHTGASVEAEMRGLHGVLADDFASPPSEPAAALAWADLTSSPAGERCSAEERLAEILGRYPPDSIVHRTVAASREALLSTAAWIDARVGCVQPI